VEVEFMIRRIFTVGTLLVFSMPLFAQKAHSPYSGEQHREIKALSPAELRDI
jgi:pyrimidine deaminase RibD-like protein